MAPGSKSQKPEDKSAVHGAALQGFKSASCMSDSGGVVYLKTLAYTLRLLPERPDSLLPVFVNETQETAACPMILPQLFTL